MHIVDVFQCAFGGVLLGVGLQTRASIINLVGYFVISAPVAYILAFPCGMGLDGMRGCVCVRLGLVS